MFAINGEVSLIAVKLKSLKKTINTLSILIDYWNEY